MKRIPVIIGILVALGAGAGVYALVKSHGAASAGPEEDTTPTLVSVQTGALKRLTLHRYVTGNGSVEPANSRPPTRLWPRPPPGSWPRCMSSKGSR